MHLRDAGLPALLILSFATACGDSISGPIREPPVITVVTVRMNPLNALAAIVSVTVTNADSLRVRYENDNGVAYSEFSSAIDGENRLPVLGLQPSVDYTFSVEAWGADTNVVSLVSSLTTGTLPVALTELSLAMSGDAPAGFYITAVTGSDSVGYVVAFDESGSLRWYRPFPEGPLGEVKQQANGNFTVFVGSTSGWQTVPGGFVEFTPSGDIVRTYGAGPAFFTDNHELLLTFTDGEPVAAHLFGYDHRVTDMSAYGGPVDALLAGHVLVRTTISGVEEFRWSGWDHFTLDGWIEGPPELKTLPVIDFDHPNALAFDHDGNYLVSWRHLAEINNIHAETGELLWRFGGVHNQFQVIEDPLGGFSAQHFVRMLENGDLLLFDNGIRHEPPVSRAVQYRLNVPARTAQLVWEYRHDPPIVSAFAGSAQRLASGNTLMGWSPQGIVTEVTPGGDVVWEGRLLSNGSSRGFYRMLRVPSLYRFRTP